MFTGIVMIISAWVVEMPVWLSILITICGAFQIIQIKLNDDYYLF